MSVEPRLFIHDPEFAGRAGVLQLLCQHVEACGEAVHILVQPPKKSREQEKRYHAMLKDIARDLLFYGRALPLDSWKRLCIDAFKHDTNNETFPRLRSYWTRYEGQLLPALNNPGFVTTGEQSRVFPQYVAAAFIEWLQAFGDCPDAPASCVTSTGRVRWTAPDSIEYHQGDFR